MDLLHTLDKEALDRLAEKAGLAVSLVDASGSELFTANNNSICRTLNPAGKFTGQCAAFCGTAFEEVSVVGGPVSFTCHAGLECHSVPVKIEGKILVAIVGRTFLSAENYRRATERALSGDWKDNSPSELFENVLLSESAEVIKTTAEKMQQAIEQTPRTTERVVEAPQPEKRRVVDRFVREVRDRQAVKEEPTTPEKPKPAAPTDDRKTAATQAWRAFFGSLLKTDHAKATAAILEFITRNFGLKSMVWLERRNGELHGTIGSGELKGRRVKLGLASDDERLIEAMRTEMPLELGEKPKGQKQSTRRMSLFPIGVGGEISSAIATLDDIGSNERKRQIARICQSVAAQIEILRLRKEVERREMLAGAVRGFSDSLRNIDSDDLWFKLTQKAAEMLSAERASLLVLEERSRALEIKALIGARSQFDWRVDPGTRVARVVLMRNEPVFITNVAETSLPPTPADRQYRSPSFLSCPLTIGGRTIGVMSFTDRAGGRPFDKDSLDLFQAVAPQLAVAIDRATLKEKAGEFEQLSVTDPLTKLLNRRYIEERLDEEVKRSNRHGLAMSFMMLDVDHFKSYNDQFGHPAGDDALKIVGNVIRETLRSADVAARFGGEEFAILLPQTVGEEAAAIAERIRTNIESTTFPHREVTMSIGVASCSAELCSTENIVSAADRALYEAKRSGRNRIKTHEEIINGGE